jgi:7,8-dihydropterin-6-yl-methyl-4-(beta-D-ribofuranosyl)aminobenzene 5'-phosphate synthase
MQITILADNFAATNHTLAEHGLAYWIDTGTHRVLFDTGQGRVLAANAAALGIDLARADAVVLSHGHYDHTGGLPWVLQQTAAPVFGHPETLLSRYHVTAGGARAIGIPEASQLALLSRPAAGWKIARGSVEVVPDVRTTGEVPRAHPEENVACGFSLDPEGREPEPLRDDQSLLLETAAGTVVLLGCAHAGVINTVEHARTLAPGRPVHAVIGGMHLGEADDTRLRWTCVRLHDLAPSLVVPLHCTGMRATVALWTALPNACRSGGTGATFAFANR